MRRTLIDRLNKKSKSLLTAGLIGVASLIHQETNADLIEIYLDGHLEESVGGSQMWLRNMEGGKLGVDSNDSKWDGVERPPGSPPIWLRVYSDQWNQYYNRTNQYFLFIDARPYSGPDMNKPFPLRADVQGLSEGQTITATNCFFRFQASPYYGDIGHMDTNRPLYNWTLTINPTYGAFTDGTTNKSGVFDLTQGSTFETPRFNITNVPGNTPFLNFNLTPSLKTTNYTVDVVSKYEPWFGTNTIGNPSGAGSYPAGTNVTVSVDKYVLNPTNQYMRLRAAGANVSDK
ncbi:MAG: hypothetical protein ACP5T0_11725 [Verrucomicrobiia bacterium]